MHEHEVAVPSDPSKPLPGDVLHAFALGSEFRNRLCKLQSEAENCIYLTPSEKDLKNVQIMTASADEGSFLEHERDSPKLFDIKHPDCSKEREIILSLSLDSPHASKYEEDGAVPSKEIEAGVKVPLHTSQMIKTLDTKVCISFILLVRALSLWTDAYIALPYGFSRAQLHKMHYFHFLYL